LDAARTRSAQAGDAAWPAAAEMVSHSSLPARRSSYQASRDDLAVYVALAKPAAASAPHTARWYSHITALLGSR